METGKMLPDAEPRLSPVLTVPALPLEDPLLDELSRKMLAWSCVWFGSEGGDATAEHYRVRERLLGWLQRCIGGEAGGILSNRAEDLSLATSTPLLTAFLGRRAVVELSRRVLNDS